MNIYEAAENISIDLWQAVGIRVHKSPDAYYFASGSPSPYYNKGVVRQEAKAPQAAVDEIVEFFTEKKLPYSIYVAENHAKWLQEGLDSFVHVQTSMVRDLQLGVEAYKGPVQIQKASCMKEFKMLLGAFQEIYSITEAALRHYFQLHLRAKAPVEYYMALLEGQVVGCGCLLRAKEYAGIYNIGTKESKRMQGVGTAMVAELLNAAQRHGYRHAFLYATPEGIPLYRKSGFEELVRYRLYLT